MNIENERVKHIRTNILNMTVEQFAESIGVSNGTISNINQGKNVSIDVALKISKKHGFSLDYIYGLSEDEKDTAGTMLIYLTKLFEYRVDPECSRYPHILYIMKPVCDFLDGYYQANKLFEDGKIPESAYIPWIDKLKMDFNSAFKEDCTREAFCLIPKKDRDEFVNILDCDKSMLIERAIEQNKVKFTSAAAKRDFVSRASERVAMHGTELLGFDEFLTEQCRNEPDQFFDENKPRFTAPKNNSIDKPNTQGLLEMFRK